ncbi:MAG: PTS sugar transporter subunit IIA [Candidatus Wallbacteria bacterium HGW-Wallbacteria-1]|jgi:mannitol/fructose-specific phosphotransferase system IIA component (Ntr-type)|uniref:PTS sugar transporter subunit IIA n=1 Tax=Candidatus Wallbacteria bacterium HGW-Wallbacteria-1 TaxID=2013854 RepID=A0A2N1PRF3_9BACT|nr:MAG: PTS sugar transporter subunit IIA [Candidatus Wallbacteria bacterium HGW-Wallbacteria-1]
MKISDCLSIDRIIDLECDRKAEVMECLIDVTSTASVVHDKEDFRQAILRREEILSTGIGLGLAVPHAKIGTVSSLVMSLGRHLKGIDFDSLDGNPVNFVVMIGANKDDQQGYLNILAEISGFFKDVTFRDRIMRARGPEEIMALFS